jgi:hypothetical protein
MTDDLEAAIRDQARDLAHLYKQLSTAIRTPPPPREARIMAAKPGPREPGNLFLISLDRDLVSRLHEYTRDCCNHLDPSRIITWDGAELCGWIAFNAQGVSELAFAPDLLEELQHQAHTLNRRLNPPTLDKAANQDPYLTADSIQRSLTNKGMECNPDTIRQWAHRGHVATKTRRDGKRAYRLGDIIKRLTGEK